MEVHCDPHELVEKFVAIYYYHRPHHVPAQEPQPVHVPCAFELFRRRCNVPPSDRAGTTCDLSDSESASAWEIFER